MVETLLFIEDPCQLSNCRGNYCSFRKHVFFRQGALLFVYGTLEVAKNRSLNRREKKIAVLILNWGSSLKSFSHWVSLQKVGLLYKCRYYFKVIYCSVLFLLISSNFNNKTVYLINDPR